MDTHYDVKAKRWTNRTTNILPRHDLYFGTPVNTPTAGIPLGDGDMGTLLWTEKDGLHLHINKCDLWQDAPPGVTWDDTCYCSGHEEELTCLKHGGEITVKFNAPVFEYLYQQAYEARLSLADAAATIHSKTPFGTFDARAFASAEAGVTFLTCAFDAPMPESTEIRLSRFGSRTLWRWYCQQKFTPETSLDGTDAFAEKDMLFITQDLGATKFCLGLAVISETTKTETQTLNGHCVRAALAPYEKQRFTLCFCIRTAVDTAAAKTACRDALKNAVHTGERALYEAHRAAWELFWNRSYIEIGNDYIENEYALYLYIMNSESRGAFPPHFTSGLWGFYHDYIPWVYYFHYNMQHMYAPLDAAGHGDLAGNYYEMRKNSLLVFRRYANLIKKKNGIFVHDVTDRFGRGADYDSLNCTPASQIAMQMYRHWRYTGDDTFLREYALPFMHGAAEFYLDLLQKEEDGLYHIHGTTAYEGNAPTDDTLTDLVMIKTLFSALLPFTDGDFKNQLECVLQGLPSPELVPLEQKDDLNGDVFAFGIGKCAKPVGDGKVLSIGRRNGAPVRKTYGDPNCEKRGYGFPDIELSPLYPAGIQGLGNRGSELYDAIFNDLMLHQPGEKCGHWNILPIYLARMGLDKEAMAACVGMLQGNQGFINGFNAEVGEPGSIAERPNCFYNVRNTLNDETSLLRPDDFIHFDFETVPIVAQAVTDMLLQSHEGVIRVFPAISADTKARFNLYAEGGFTVGAEINGNSFVIAVKSLRGEPCRIILPEVLYKNNIFIYLSDDCGEWTHCEVQTEKYKADTAICLHDLKQHGTVLLSSETINELILTEQPVSDKNNDVKICGPVSLGSPHLMQK